MSDEQTSAARRQLAQIAKAAYAVTKVPQDPLDHLRTITTLRWRLDQAQQQLVDGARDAGASWGDVGRALGITRQAARERYGTTEPRTDHNQIPLWPFDPTEPPPGTDPSH